MVNIFELAKNSRNAALARYFNAKSDVVTNQGYNKDGRAATANAKTPIQNRKDGGKVEGEKPKMRLDKMPRKKANGGIVDAGATDAKQMEDASAVVNAAQARKKRLAGVGLSAMKKGGVMKDSVDAMVDKTPSYTKSKMTAKKSGGCMSMKMKKADGGGISEEDKLGMNELLRNIERDKKQAESDKDPTRGSKYAGEKDYKKGGKVKHDDAAMDKKLIKKMISDEDKKEKYKAGGNVSECKNVVKKAVGNEGKSENYKRGGAVKGKTSINIVIAPSNGAPAGGMVAPMGIMPAGPAGAIPVPPMPMGGPDMPPPPMGGAPMPMRKDGGTVNMNYGAGGGKGRLQKIQKYGK